MPIFDFRCSKCEHMFEKIVLKESAEIICPKCGCNSVQKMVSSTNFYIKGYSYKNGYSKQKITDNDIIKGGPNKAIDQMNLNMRK